MKTLIKNSIAKQMTEQITRKLGVEVLTDVEGLDEKPLSTWFQIKRSNLEQATINKFESISDDATDFFIKALKEENEIKGISSDIYFEIITDQKVMEGEETILENNFDEITFKFETSVYF